MTNTITMPRSVVEQAMQGMLVAPSSTDGQPIAGIISDGLRYADDMRGCIAVAAYAMADAMLSARGSS